jgi:Ca2+:H+ antiporter
MIGARDHGICLLGPDGNIRSQPGRRTLLFLLSVAAIVPLAALLSRATESAASKARDMIGGLLNPTLGSLTELLIALTALRTGQ